MWRRKAITIGVGRYALHVDSGGPNLVLSRPFRAGPLDFFVGSTDPALTALASSLFEDLPSPPIARNDLPIYVLSPALESSGRGTYDLSGPVVGTVNGVPLATSLTLLVSALNKATLDAEPERLHLHAAAVVRDGRGALFAAPRETGKTTTLGRLVLNGWDYISDETVSIAPGDDSIRGYAKPVSIKPHGRVLLPELADHFLPPNELSEDAVLHVALGALGATACGGAEPHLVALLRRMRDPSGRAKATSSILHPVDAVVGLMQETLDAGRFGRDAVLELARLAARCHCHEIVVGDPASTVAEIERLFVEPAVEPLTVEALPERSPINPNVRSVLIGDRVVIHELPAGRILALDSTATQIWLNIGGWPATETIDLTGPVVESFVSRLIELGLVRDSASP